MWHCDRMPPLPQVSLWHFCAATSAPVNCKSWYCEVGASSSSRPRTLTEQGLQVLKLLACLPLEATAAEELCARELHEMGFHGWAAMPSVSWSGVKPTATRLWFFSSNIGAWPHKCSFDWMGTNSQTHTKISWKTSGGCYRGKEGGNSILSLYGTLCNMWMSWWFPNLCF